MTGLLNYEGKEYIFILENDRLTIEALDNVGGHCFVPEWFTNPPKFGDEFLYGTDFQTEKKVAIKPCYEKAGIQNTRLIVHVLYYVEYTGDMAFSGMSVVGEELNRIYDIRKAIRQYDMKEEGEASVSTKPFSDTTSKELEFKMGDKIIKFYFTVYRGIEYQSTTPLKLYSCLNFKFDIDTNLEQIYEIWRITYQVIQYLSNRQDVDVFSVDLYSPYKETMRQKVGKLVVPRNTMKKDYDIKTLSRVLPFSVLNDSLALIFQDVVDGNLYTRHLPHNLEDSRIIDCAKFILTTAAIEWISKQIYPNGIKKKAKTEEAISIVGTDLDEKIRNSTGEIKAQYKFLRKVLGSDSLSSKLIQIGNDYKNVLDPFGKFLFSLNGAIDEFDYSKIGERIQKQRNDFAHGNIDQEFNGVTALDIMFLERMAYILQLSRYKMSDEDIINGVKVLFGMH